MTKSFFCTSSPARTASWMLGTSALVAAAIVLTPAVDAVAQEVGKAAAVNPAAQSRGAGGARTIVIGQSIAHRERIQTTAAGSVQLLFIDKTSMTIGPNSDLAIDEYVFDPATNTGKMAATLTKGVMRFVGGQVSHQGNAQVTTPNAVVGIRGGVAIISTQNVFIGYGQGQVSSGSSSVTLGAGDFTQTMGSGIAPTPPAPPPPNFVLQQVNAFQSGAGQGGGARASGAQVNNARTAATGSSGGSIATASAASTVNNVQQSAATSQNNQSSTSSTVTQTVQTSTQTTAAVVTANEIQQQPPPNNNPPDNPPPNNPPPNNPPPNNNPFPVNGAFAFGMTNCCSLTAPVSNAPYLPASFAAGSNSHTSLMLGHISSAGGPDAAVTLQYGFGVSGGANANQSSWFFVATGGIFVDGETAILGGSFGGTRRDNGASFPTVAYGAFSTPANAFTSTDPNVIATVNNNTYLPETKTFQTTPSFIQNDISQAPTSYTFTQRFAPATVQPTGLGSNRPSVYLNAYVGGMMQSTSTPTGGTGVTGSPFAVTGTGYVQLDATSGRLQADFSVSDGVVTNGNGFSATYLTGLISTSGRPQSAYVDYDNFGSREYVNVNSSTGAVTQNSTVKGQTPTRATIAVANVPRAVAQQLVVGAGASGQTVCNCEYTRWGFWSADTTRAGNGAGQVRDSGHMMTWVAGQRPDIGEVPTQGTASYAGHVVANVNNNGNQYIAAGNLQNTINFGTRTGQVDVTGFDGANYSGGWTPQPDPRDLSASLQSSTGGRTMTMTGSLFRGPNSPVGEMGGSVLVNGGNYSASGIFAASKLP